MASNGNFWTALAFLLLMAANHQVSAAQLVSIRGIELKNGAYIWNVNIEIHHARIIAVCRILDGWTTQEENHAEFASDKDLGAHFSAEATVGHVALSNREINQLQNLLLIEEQPKTGTMRFEGSYHIEGVLEGEAQTGDHKLANSSFALKTADRCP